MEQLYLEIPSINRKAEIINYINELEKYNSEINGIEVFAKILNGYTFEQALEYCFNIENIEYAKKLEKSQMKTFLLIRKNDDKIVGALNIRWNLPENIKQFGGNIGYGIRPTERKKGYNKINLYLGLIEAKKIGLKEVKLVCETNNLCSVKTIEALDGILQRVEIDPCDGVLTSIYWLNVDKTINKYKDTFKNDIYKVDRNI